MSYKATKPGLVSVLYLSMFYIVLVFIRAPFYVLLVFIVYVLSIGCYPRRARSALGVDTVLTLDVCMFVCMLGL